MTLDSRHTIALPYWARPGFALFAKKADDEDEGADLTEDEDDEDDEDEDDDLADLSEEELRAELKRTRESLSKASGSSKAKRDRIKRLNAELADARKPAKKADDDEKVDAEAVKAAAIAEARAESDSRIRKTAARAELKAAGIPADQVSRLVGLIEDLDDLDVDEDGNVDGLDDAIDELKAAWPQLFNVKPIRSKRQSVAGGNGDEATKRKLSPSQVQAARATGKRAG